MFEIILREYMKEANLATLYYNKNIFYKQLFPYTLGQILIKNLFKIF